MSGIFFGKETGHERKPAVKIVRFFSGLFIVRYLAPCPAAVRLLVRL